MQIDKNIRAENAGWTFEGIADQFDEHIRRSIPNYDEGHALICKLSDFFLPKEATVVELGSSTGVLAERFLTYNKRRADIRYIAIDRVEDMLELGRSRCLEDNRVQFINDDIVTCSLEKSTMIISYYTMQFISPRSRQEVFNKIFDALNWGGVFILFEKVRAPDARFQDIATQLYTDFKLDQGFNEVEIVAKQRSLKGILEPFSTQGNLDMLKRAGFIDIMTIMKVIMFEGWLAIK